MSRILVAYFSAQGTTERAAQTLAEAAGADLHEMKPEVPYTAADLNYMDNNARSTVEMRNKDSRPAIKPDDLDMDAYDTVFLGFPIWWYVAPTIINTFLESHDFSGKKIILFATSGGSGFGRTAAGLALSVSADTTIVEGKLLNGRQDVKSLKVWVEKVI